MADLSNALFDINNEYRKRITRVLGHLTLLEGMIRTNSGAEPGLRAALRRMRATLEAVSADHSQWRHAYFYRQATDSQQRMVAEPREVQRALRAFSQMLGQHLTDFDLILDTLDTLPRPDPSLTRVLKNQDLWLLCREGIEGLARYDQYAQSRLPHRMR